MRYLAKLLLLTAALFFSLSPAAGWAQIIEEITVLSSAARTATTNSADLTNFNAKGVALFLDVTSAPGASETLTVAVQMKDPVSGSYRTITAFTTAPDAVDTYIYNVHPSSVDVEARGTVKTIVGTNPAAGVEISETVPAGFRWRILAARIMLTTDATAISRRVQLFLDDGANIYLRSTAGEVQGTTANNAYNLASGLPTDFVPLLNQFLGIPDNLVLPPGHRIRTGTINLQAGDDFAAPILLVEEFPVVDNVETDSSSLPRTWRVSVTHSAGGSWTYSIGASYID